MKSFPTAWVVLIVAAPILLLNVLLLYDYLYPAHAAPETRAGQTATLPAIHTTTLPAPPPMPPPSPTVRVSPSPTQTILPTLTVSATSVYATLASTPVASPTSAYATPVSTPIASPLPKEAEIRGLPRRGQVYPLSCEAHIAVTLAAWYGVSIPERDFQARLPLSDNPELGFVGDVHGDWGQTPPNDYGVHAPPVAALLQTYGVPAQAHKGMTWAQVQREIAAGRPVGVWVTGHVGRGTPMYYHTRDGSMVTVAPFEHTVIVIGYTSSEVIIQDGAGIYRRSLGDFLRSWSALRNMAITIAP